MVYVADVNVVLVDVIYFRYHDEPQPWNGLGQVGIRGMVRYD